MLSCFMREREREREGIGERESWSERLAPIYFSLPQLFKELFWVFIINVVLVIEGFSFCFVRFFCLFFMM